MDEDAEQNASAKATIPCSKKSSSIRNAKMNCTFTWTIYNFSFAFDEVSESSFSSASFATGCNNELNWDLNIHPNEENKTHVGLKIYLYDTYEFFEVLAEFEISILNDKGEKAYTQKSDSMHNFVKDNWYSKDFIQKNYLMDVANGLLINDKLILMLSINADCNYIVTNEEKDFMLHLSRNRLQISNDFKLLLDGRDHDVVMLLDGKKFNVHKSILAARSRVFSAMFEHQMLETTNHEVTITDISCEALNKLIQYVYSGNIENINEISEEIIKELLVAADKYELDDLKFMCEVILFNRLNLNNAIETLVFADSHNADALRKQVIQFIIGHNREFIDDPAFESLSEAYPHLLPRFIAENIEFMNSDVDELFYGTYINNFDVPIVSMPVKPRFWGVTQLQVNECSYTWKIQNFSFFANVENSEYSVQSQKFSKSDSSYHWQLTLFPRGVNEETKDYISLLIQLFADAKAKKTEVKAYYEFFIINKEDKPIKSVKSDILIFISNGEKLGETAFLKRDFILDNDNGLLIDDTLTIMCKITWHLGNVNSVTHTESMNFCLPKYQLGVSNDLEELLKNGKFSDIQFTVCNTEFQVHRTVLSVRCPTIFSCDRSIQR